MQDEQLNAFNSDAIMELRSIEWAAVVVPEACLCDTLAKIADGHPINRIDELMPWSSL